MGYEISSFIVTSIECVCKSLCHHYYYCSTHAIVHCVVFSCGTTDLAPPVNGQLTVESTLFGSVASYSCDSGYYLVGDAMRTCLLGMELTLFVVIIIMVCH